MANSTDNLALPYILPDQAQKHVTHNEALQRLDQTVQMSLKAITATPPTSPANSECYAIIGPATGVFAGMEGQLAMRVDDGWLFATPRKGFIAWLQTSLRHVMFDGTSWTALKASSQQTDIFGINATADTTNRLSLNADASLFNHNGAGHQLKINKATVDQTASLLLQDGFSGRAEIGLPAADDLTVKVSGDGASWKTALTIGSADGVLRQPQRPYVRATSNGTGLLTMTAGVSFGFATFTVVQGNWTLGPTLVTGSPTYFKPLIVPVTGNYLISCTYTVSVTAGSVYLSLMNGSTALSQWKPANNGMACFTTMASLAAGSTLFTSVTQGAGGFDGSAGRYELTAVFL